MSKTAYIFPGQGSQYVEMGMDLYNTYPSAKAVFDRADEILGFPLSKLCFEGPEEELMYTVNAQPALLVTSIAALEAVREVAPAALPQPAYMAGHSLGEYTALAATGALKFDTAVTLVRERGRLMYEAGLEEPGAMGAVIGMDRETLADICKETGVYIANLNCPGQTVVSGAKENVSNTLRSAKEHGAKLAIKLQVSGAFHSPLMLSAAKGLEPHIKKTEIADPAVPVIGNTAAQEMSSSEMIRDELLEQVCHCVQWEDTISFLLSCGVDCFIEIGPGQVLTGLVRRISENAVKINIGNCDDIEALAYA